MTNFATEIKFPTKQHPNMNIKQTTTSTRLALTFLAAIAVLPSCGSSDTTPADKQSNADKPKQQILTEADPTIFKDSDGTYYLYGTSSESSKGFLVYKSSNLDQWTGPVGAVDGFCLTNETSFGTTGFWAPQVFKRDDTYYMFYTANEQIAVATAKSPLGPFTQSTKKMVDAPCKTIDPFVLFDTDGKAYLYHVRLQQGNRIFVAELSDDLSSIVESTAKECISASLTWEDTANADWTVTEGPTVLHIGDTYYMFYSANDFRNIDYAVGVATAKSPYGPWTKSEQPIISRTNIGRYGTGHGDLFTDAKGNWQYVFHTHNSFTEVAPRKTGVVGVTFQHGTFTADADSFHYLYLEK